MAKNFIKYSILLWKKPTIFRVLRSIVGYTFIMDKKSLRATPFTALFYFSLLTRQKEYAIIKKKVGGYI